MYFLVCRGPSIDDVGVLRDIVFQEIRPGAGFETGDFGKEKIGGYRRTTRSQKLLLCWQRGRTRRGVVLEASFFIQLRGTRRKESGYRFLCVSADALCTSSDTYLNEKNIILTLSAVSSTKLGSILVRLCKLRATPVAHFLVGSRESEPSLR